MPGLRIGQRSYAARDARRRGRREAKRGGGKNQVVAVGCGNCSPGRTPGFFFAFGEKKAKDEGKRVSREFEECGRTAPTRHDLRLAHSSRRTPVSMQRIGPGSLTKDDLVLAPAARGSAFCLLLFGHVTVCWPASPAAISRRASARRYRRSPPARSRSRRSR